MKFLSSFELESFVCFIFNYHCNSNRLFNLKFSFTYIHLKNILRNICVHSAFTFVDKLFIPSTESFELCSYFEITAETFVSLTVKYISTFNNILVKHFFYIENKITEEVSKKINNTWRYSWFFKQFDDFN